MPRKEAPPSIKETAFCCPYCGAFTTQHWLSLYAQYHEDKYPTPSIPDREAKDRLLKNAEVPEEAKSRILEWYQKMLTGNIFFEKIDGKSMYRDVNNLFLSECYNCKQISVWVHERLVFPNQKEGSEPNQDLPEDIIRDFEEARSIVGLSPRGAAALLRLTIQKLCIYLGEKGKNLDEDIASLVSKGLNPLIQKSLDIVRVIGNEAVHPGVIDLRDDRDTANELFDLINSIADQMITHLKNVEKLYERLPASKREAIKKRNGEAKK
ncbi:MAG: DUF4145 domain-containing protein [Candidatus Hodarchaeota archaeon]